VTTVASDERPADDLAAGRSEIERVDRAIIRLLRERLQAATIVVAAKRANNLPVLDPAQEARVVRRAGEWAREAALPDDDVRDLFWRIIAITRCAEGEQL
jgi:chorismate mutase